MDAMQARLFAIRHGARTGVLISSGACLVLGAIIVGVFVIGGIMVYPERVATAAGVLVYVLIILLASLVGGAIIGAVGGAAVGLVCHEVLSRHGSPAIASLCGAALGAATGFLALRALNALLWGPSDEPLSATVVAAFCLVTAFGGLMISRGMIQDYA